jgi:hypothetical protein
MQFLWRINQGALFAPTAAHHLLPCYHIRRMGKTFRAKLPQELHCDIGCMGVGVVMDKNYFFCEQARPFILVGFLLVLQCYTVVVCILCCPVVQELMKENICTVKEREWFLMTMSLPIQPMHSVILGAVVFEMSCPSTMQPKPCT